MTLTLPQVVETVSTAISAANELWHGIDYPEDNEQQQTQSFLVRITELASEFLEAQQDLEKMIRQHVKEKRVLVESLSAELEAEFQVTATSACAEFDELCRFEKLFEEEKTERVQELSKLNEELSVCCEDANEPFTVVQSVRESDLRAAQQRIHEIRQKLRPQYDELSRVCAQVKQLVLVLGRRECSQAVQRGLDGVARISDIGELEAASEQMQAQLEQRRRQIALTTQEILNIQAVLQQTNTFLAVSQVETTLSAVLLRRAPFLLLENDYTDTYFSDLMREFNELHGLLRENKPLIIKQLIAIRTDLLHEINPLYVNYECDGEILQLQREIELLRRAKLMVQPIIANVQQFNEFQLMSRELASIQKDTSRFTSRGREGVKMREREEFLKKEIGSNFPKAIAALKFKLDELHSEFQENEFELSISDVLGKDYYLDINKILQTENKAFTQRYEQFLAAFGRQRMALSKRDGINQIKTPRRLSQSAGLRKSKLGASRSGVTPVIKKRE